MRYEYLFSVAVAGYFQAGQQDQGGLGVQPGAWNGSLLDNLNNQFQLRNISLLFRSYCGQDIQRVLNNRTANITFFAPSDQSISKVLDMSSKLGAAEFNCSTTSTNASSIAQYCRPDMIPSNLTGVPFFNISACSPLILQYHVVPEQVLNLTLLSNQSQSGGMMKSRAFVRLQQQQQPNIQNGNTKNVTVLKTMLNDTRFVHLPNNQSQVLILNQTDSGYYLKHGAWPDSTIRVNETIKGVNGIAYIVDGILMPPLNLTATLQKYNLSSFAQSLSQSATDQSTPFAGSVSSPLQSSQEGIRSRYDLMQGITVFAPVQGNVQNASSYIIPNQVIYNNGSLASGFNASAADGQNYHISSSSNFTMQFGNATVIESNILLSNGVMHIIDGPVNSTATGGTGNLTQGFLARFC